MAQSTTPAKPKQAPTDKERVRAQARGNAKPAAEEPTAEPAVLDKAGKETADQRADDPRDSHATADIETLLATANDAGAAARNAWLGFNAILAYLLITIASTSHQDLLLNSQVALPIIDIKLPLFSFYGFAPVLLILLHLGLLVQHAVTARKLHELDQELKDFRAAGDISQRYVHRVRTQLTFYVFCQVLVGPYRKPGFLAHVTRFMIWISIIILPLATFLAFQISFLPYHDLSLLIDLHPDKDEAEIYRLVGLTWFHRIWFVLDLVMVWYLWPVIKWGEGSFWTALKIYKPYVLFPSIVAAFTAVLFSVFVATIPGEWTENAMVKLFPSWRVERNGRPIFPPTAWLFETGFQHFDGNGPGQDTAVSKSPFQRNLIVPGTNLVDDTMGLEDDAYSLALNNRDLRFGDFRSTDFFRANLANSQLQGSILREADLKSANLENARLNGADLIRTDLQAARLNGAGLLNAKMLFTILRDASLQSAGAQGANLDSANLEGADLSRVDFRGATLRATILKSANLTGAQLQGAVLDHAFMQGAILNNAHFTGASLNGTHLQGTIWLNTNAKVADLTEADLTGADLASAQLQGAILDQARVWGTIPPAETAFVDLVDLKLSDISPPTEAGKAELRQVIRHDPDDSLRKQMSDHLTAILNAPPSSWTGARFWHPAGRAAPDPGALASLMATLACQDTAGWVLQGVERQLSTEFREFAKRGVAVKSAFDAALKSPECAKAAKPAQTAFRTRRRIWCATTSARMPSCIQRMAAFPCTHRRAML